MQKKRSSRRHWGFELLESRLLLSANVSTVLEISTTLTSTQVQANAVFRPTYEIERPALSPFQTSGPQGYTPDEIRTAYGLNQVVFGSQAGDGAGQTIAIIDAYNDPNIRSDLHAFDGAFGLADPTLRVVGQDGSANLPGVDPVGPGDESWEGETALDVEWAHALAPGATILLVEARDASPTNLFAAVNFARNQAGVSVVSMSFGGNETLSETQYDANFLTPSGHNGVTFIASSGDSGTPGGYPAYSPNVLATGGTSLAVDSQGNYQSEIGWNGSGGGISQVEPKPSYQKNVTQSSTLRADPDVAFNADPRTGVAIYDSYDNGSAAPWEVIGGTSAAAPSWAGIIAIVDQGRALAGEGTLDSRTGTLPLIYSAPAADFHDIVSGNNGLAASTGYDLVTGRGSPKANLLIPYMVTGSPLPSGPTIDSLTASATVVQEGSAVTLTASGVSDSVNTGLTVTFYQETNGIAGLQTGANGDLAFTPVTNGSNSIVINMSNVPGLYTFYAQLTDSRGGASATGTDAPSVNVAVIAPTNSGPIVAGISATPNPVMAGESLFLTPVGVTDISATVRRVTFYQETNGIAGLQTGPGGDFAFRPISANGSSLELDTSGVTGDFTFYAQATDSVGNVSAAGTSAPSVTVTVVPNGLPATPTDLTAAAVSTSEIDLTFADSDSTQDGFTIERTVDPNFVTFTRVFSINRSDGLTYTDTGLSPGTKYYYRVQAFNASGNSGFSNIANAATVQNSFAPTGSVDVYGPLVVSGWAIDRDTPNTAETVALDVDGSVFATMAAGGTRNDLIRLFGSANHGYSFSLAGLAPGIHRIDVFAIDTATGVSWRLGVSRTVDTNLAPEGSFDAFNGSMISGWAFDFNSGATPIQIRYQIDGSAPFIATASVVRSDLTHLVGSADHGYKITLPQLTAGLHTIRVYAIDPVSDALVFLGSRSATVANGARGALPIGSLDVATPTRVAGWALDANAAGSSVMIRIDVDGVTGTPFATNIVRHDVSNAFHVAGTWGFNQTLALTPGEHRVDLYAIDVPTGTPVLIASRILIAPLLAGVPAIAAGSIDAATAAHISGWAWSPGLSGASALIRIDIDNQVGTPVLANASRHDVAAHYGAGNFGYSETTPLLQPGLHTLTLWLIDPLTFTPVKLVTRALET